MDVELTYDAEKNEYCLFRGCDLVLQTSSYAKAIDVFNILCDQVRGATCSQQKLTFNMNRMKSKLDSMNLMPKK